MDLSGKSSLSEEYWKNRLSEFIVQLTAMIGHEIPNSILAKGREVTEVN